MLWRGCETTPFRESERQPDGPWNG